MEHYITKIEIEKLRHLSDINIYLNTEKRQHLLLTGKNDSGKTTVLLAIQKYLKDINDRKLNILKYDDSNWLNSAKKGLETVTDEKELYKRQKEYEQNLSFVRKYSDGLPFLTTFFPRIQFIVTTHSPYILNSIANSKAYDLEKKVELENLSAYSSKELAEGYFNADAYAEELKHKLYK